MPVKIPVKMHNLIGLLVLVVFLSGCGSSGGDTPVTTTSIETTTTTTTVTSTTETPTTSTTSTTTAAQAAVAALSFEAFTCFPIPLEKVFEYDNPVQQVYHQQDIFPAGSFHFLAPFAEHTADHKAMGRAKWYYSCENQDQEPNYFVGHGILTVAQNQSFINKTSADLVTISGEACYSESILQVFIAPHAVVVYMHISVLRSIRDALIASPNGYLELNAGQLLGFAGGEITILDTATNNGLSTYQYCEANVFTYPLPYFSVALQQSLEASYQQVVYDYIKNNDNCHVWPQSSMYNPYNINVTGEVWGIWFYESGLGVSTLEVFVTELNMGIIDLLKKDYTVNMETFDPSRIAGSTPANDFLGVYLDLYHVDFTGSRYYGQRCLYQDSGSTPNTDGIFLMLKDGTAEAYGRYRFVENDPTTRFDDLLYLGIGGTPTLAEEEYTNNPLIYTRDLGTKSGTSVSFLFE